MYYYDYDIRLRRLEMYCTYHSDYVFLHRFMIFHFILQISSNDLGRQQI